MGPANVAVSMCFDSTLSTCDVTKTYQGYGNNSRTAFPNRAV